MSIVPHDYDWQRKYTKLERLADALEGIIQTGDIHAPCGFYLVDKEDFDALRDLLDPTPKEPPMSDIDWSKMEPNALKYAELERLSQCWVDKAAHSEDCHDEYLAVAEFLNPKPDMAPIDCDNCGGDGLVDDVTCFECNGLGRHRWDHDFKIARLNPKPEPKRADGNTITDCEPEEPRMTSLRGALARAYCRPETEKKVMDPVLVKAMEAQIIEEGVIAEPQLGCATTRELLAEISARIEICGSNGGWGLDYKTVGEGFPSGSPIREDAKSDRRSPGWTDGPGGRIPTLREAAEALMNEHAGAGHWNALRAALDRDKDAPNWRWLVEKLVDTAEPGRFRKEARETLKEHPA